MTIFRFASGELSRRLSKTILFLSFVTMITACEEKGQPSAPAQMPPAMVSVIIMAPHSVPFRLELPATLSGGKEVEIRAQVSGILRSRNFNEGDKVVAQQSLFTIDTKLYQAEVTKNQAELTAAIARYEQAEREVNRLKPLRAKNSVSQRELDNAISSVDINAAEVKSAQAELAQADLRLNYTQVTSPITGIISRELVSEGTYISGPETLLTQLTQIDPIRIRFGLSEREQLSMRQDAAAGLLTLPENGHWQAQIKLFDGSLHPKIGQVNFSDVRINRSTGTSEIQAVVPNPDLTLRPGQFVRILLDGAKRENAFVVPQRAVLDNGLGKFVYLLKKNEQGITVALPAPITVGEWVQEEQDGLFINGWVIRSGLQTGDQVIVDGIARIFFPGMPVRLAEPEQPMPSTVH